ncbi:MAG: hypothetical protein KDI79_04675 [Anaerolineae bacterium]|nr:hypothetical protein [Anaerolineae bacterium]
MKFLIITVDTEEDWFDKQHNRITAITGLDFLQEVCAKYDMIPTYLINYVMATHDDAIAVIKNYLDEGQCEVGHHLHIWNTPPFENRNSYGVDEKWIGGLQSEIPDDLFYKKMAALHEAIEKNYGIRPTSHRAGKWAIDNRTLQWLAKNNYLVDSSVCPYLSWTHAKGINDYIKTDTYYAPNAPYYPDAKDLTKKAIINENPINILEVPVTGIGGDVLSKINVKGIDRLRLTLNKLGYPGVKNMSFRPSDTELPFGVFQKVAHCIFQSDISFINFMFHSNELTLGTSPYSMTKDRFETLRKNITFVLKTAKEYGVKGITLSQVPALYN